MLEYIEPAYKKQVLRQEDYGLQLILQIKKSAKIKKRKKNVLIFIGLSGFRKSNFCVINDNKNRQLIINPNITVAYHHQHINSILFSL